MFFRKKSRFKYTKGFKIIVGALALSWLSVLAMNLTSTELLTTDIFDADGNFIGTEVVLSEDDIAKIDLLKAEWSEQEAESNARLRAEKAVAAYNLGDFENAIALYNEALALGSFDEENRLILLSNLALAYEAEGYTESAIKTYEVILTKVPGSSAEKYVADGKIALLQEYIDVKSAIKSFEAAFKIDSDNFDVNNTLALIYMGEYGSEFTDYSKALIYNDRMGLLFPENVNVRVNLGINYMELKQYENAKANLTYVLDTQPQSLPANYLMMKVLHLSGNNIEAKKYAIQLVEWVDSFRDDKLVAEVLESN